MSPSYLAIAVPVVAAGGAAAAILDALIFMLLAIVAMAVVYWLLGSARNVAGGLPLVGGRVVTVIDALRSQTVGMMRWQEQNAINQLHAVARGLVGLVAMVVAAPLAEINRATAGLHGTLEAHDGAIRQVQAAALSELPARIRDIEAQLDANVRPRLGVVEGDVRAANAALAVQAGQLGRVLTVELPAIRAQAVSDATAAANTAAMVAVLNGYLPVLRGLADFEAGAAGGIRGLRLDQEALRVDLARARAILDQLSRLLALSALSAVALEMLSRLARDPCGVVTELCLVELDDRVESLENAGH